MNYDSPAEIRAVLEKHGLALKKRFGQNFLVNRHARERIAGLLEAGRDDLVWEIGPGLGAMTGLLLERARRVLAFEIDRGLVRALRELFPDRPSLEIIEGDALDTMGPAGEKRGAPNRILGNLPYSSASRIIAFFIEREIGAQKIVVTVQKDLALRMRASPGEKIYSSFSVLTQSFFDVRLEFDLKGGNFFPRPEVDSSVVSLVPASRLPPGPGRAVFFRLIRLAFGSRRKTLNNNLFKSGAFSPEELTAMRAFWERRELSPNARAEDLAPEVYRDLALTLAGIHSGEGTTDGHGLDG
ncbi:MAG: ribosomal RNA small subunit methyltransferase A [Spirochaetales bacterium]|nr:ribosomal RNA small subunit methyltransferase A [Spirochaetales bacterium]